MPAVLPLLARYGVKLLASEENTTQLCGMWSQMAVAQ